MTDDNEVQRRMRLFCGWLSRQLEAVSDDVVADRIYRRATTRVAKIADSSWNHGFEGNAHPLDTAQT